MDTIETAVNYIQHNNTPYWWIMSGTNKVGEYTATEDVNVSIAQFRTAVGFLPPGSYKLECSDKANNRSGSFKFPFTKAQTTGQTATAMQPAQPSTNAYGISDIVYQQIVAKAEQDFMFKQMHAEFTTFIKEWPEFKKKVEKIDLYLKDEDGDGTPDFLETAKKAGDTVKAASEIRKVFSGGSLFG